MFLLTIIYIYFVNLEVCHQLSYKRGQLKTVTLKNSDVIDYVVLCSPSIMKVHIHNSDWLIYP